MQITMYENTIKFIKYHKDNCFLSKLYKKFCTFLYKYEKFKKIHEAKFILDYIKFIWIIFSYLFILININYL